MSPFLQHVRHVHTSMMAPPLDTSPCATRQGGDKKSIQHANRHLSIILLAHRFRCGAAGSNVLRQVIHGIRQPLRVGELHEGGDSLLNVCLLRRPGGVDVVDASLQLLLGGAQAPQKSPPDSRAVPATMMMFRCTPTSCWLERIRSPGQEMNQSNYQWSSQPFERGQCRFAGALHGVAVKGAPVPPQQQPPHAVPPQTPPWPGSLHSHRRLPR